MVCYPHCVNMGCRMEYLLTILCECDPRFVECGCIYLWFGLHFSFVVEPTNDYALNTRRTLTHPTMRPPPLPPPPPPLPSSPHHPLPPPPPPLPPLPHPTLIAPSSDHHPPLIVPSSVYNLNAYNSFYHLLWSDGDWGNPSLPPSPPPPPPLPPLASAPLPRHLCDPGNTNTGGQVILLHNGRHGLHQAYTIYIRFKQVNGDKIDIWSILVCMEIENFGLHQVVVCGSWEQLDG